MLLFNLGRARDHRKSLRPRKKRPLSQSRMMMKRKERNLKRRCPNLT